MTDLPPLIYDHAPTIPVIEHIMTSDVVDRTCRQEMDTRKMRNPYPANMRFMGCAFVADGTCLVYRIDDGTVKRHEYGHCNGWRWDHPYANPQPGDPKIVVTIPIRVAAPGECQKAYCP